MSIFYSIFIIISFTIFCYGNGFSLKVESYYSTYNMNALKEAQNTSAKIINSELQIPFKKVRTFPPYFSYQIVFGLTNNNLLEYGFIMNLSSTGARSDYSDYSGRYTIDYLIKANGFGLYIEQKKTLNNSFNFVFGIKGMYIHSYLKIAENLVLYSSKQSEKIDFESTSFGFTPYLGFEYTYKIFLLRFNIGYHVNFDGKLHLADNEHAYLKTANGSYITSNWSGARIGLSIGIKLE